MCIRDRTQLVWNIVPMIWWSLWPWKVLQLKILQLFRVGLIHKRVLLSHRHSCRNMFYHLVCLKRRISLNALLILLKVSITRILGLMISCISLKVKLKMDWLCLMLIFVNIVCYLHFVFANRRNYLIVHYKIVIMKLVIIIPIRQDVRNFLKLEKVWLFYSHLFHFFANVIIGYAQFGIIVYFSFDLIKFLIFELFRCFIWWFRPGSNDFNTVLLDRNMLEFLIYIFESVAKHHYFFIYCLNLFFLITHISSHLPHHMYKLLASHSHHCLQFGLVVIVHS